MSQASQQPELRTANKMKWMSLVARAVAVSLFSFAGWILFHAITVEPNGLHPDQRSEPDPKSGRILGLADLSPMGRESHVSPVGQASAPNLEVEVHGPAGLLPGAQVEVRAVPPLGEGAQEQATWSTSLRTNEAGTARVQLPAWTVYTVSGYSSGLSSERRDVAPGRIKIVLKSAGTLELRCSDATTQQPLGGVRISAAVNQTTNQRTSVSGSSGIATMEDIPPGEYSLHVASPTYLAHSVYGIVVTAGKVAQCDIRMFQPLRIRGTVRNEYTREALSSGAVEVWYPGGCVERATLAPDGTFELTGMPSPHAMYRVIAPGYSSRSRAPTEVRRLTDETMNPVEWEVHIEARGIRQLHGIVTHKGVPIEGARVYAGKRQVLGMLESSQSLEKRKRRLGQTDSALDGTFTIDTPESYQHRPSPQLPIKLLVIAKGFAPALLSLPNEPPALPVEVALTKGASVAVQVTDDHGTPFAGTTVSLHLTNPHDHTDIGAVLRQLSGPTVTDTRGTVHVNHLTVGQWEASFTIPGSGCIAKYPFTIAEEGTYALDCTVDSKAIIRGRISDTRGQLLGPCYLLPVGGSKRDLIKVEGDGTFAIYCESPEGIQLEAFGGRVIDKQIFRARPGVECTPMLRVRAPIRKEAMRCTILDAQTGLCLPLVEYTVIHYDPAGKPRHTKKGIAPGGTFTVQVEREAEGIAEFSASGHRTQRMSLEELRTNAQKGSAIINM